MEQVVVQLLEQQLRYLLVEELQRASRDIEACKAKDLAQTKERLQTFRKRLETSGIPVTSRATRAYLEDVDKTLVDVGAALERVTEASKSARMRTTDRVTSHMLQQSSGPESSSLYTSELSVSISEMMQAKGDFSAALGGTIGGAW